jgi:probable O-glycosylation ligase (exosortase A-associated)
MLRNLLVIAILLIGAIQARRGPFFVLLLYVWVAYFRPEDWVWGDFIRSLNLSWVIGWFLVVATIFSGIRPRLTLSVCLIGAFLVHGLVSTLLSAYSDYAWRYWAEFSKVAIITYLIVMLTTDVRKYRLLLLVIALSLGFEGAKQGWAQFVLNPGARNDNPHPFLGDNNGVALGMLMLVPLFGALIATSKTLIERNIHRIFMVGVVIRALTTYSRGAFLSAGFLAILYTFRSKHKLRVIAGTALVAALILPVMPQEFWDRMQTITAPEGQRDASAEGRLHYWQVAVAMAKDEPVFGVGFNSFSRAYDSYDPTGGAFGHMRAAHSTWFGVLGDMGFPGLGLLLALILHALFTLQRTRRFARSDPQFEHLGIFATAVQTSLLVFVLGGSFLPAQYSEMLWHYLGLAAAAGLLAAEALHVRIERAVPRLTPVEM